MPNDKLTKTIMPTILSIKNSLRSNKTFQMLIEHLDNFQKLKQ